MPSSARIVRSSPLAGIQQAEVSLPPGAGAGIAVVIDVLRAFSKALT